MEENRFAPGHSNVILHTEGKMKNLTTSREKNFKRKLTRDEELDVFRLLKS